MDVSKIGKSFSVIHVFGSEGRDITSGYSYTDKNEMMIHERSKMVFINMNFRFLSKDVRIIARKYVRVSYNYLTNF